MARLRFAWFFLLLMARLPRADGLTSKARVHNAANRADFPDAAAAAIDEFLAAWQTSSAPCPGLAGATAAGLEDAALACRDVLGGVGRWVVSSIPSVFMERVKPAENPQRNLPRDEAPVGVALFAPFGRKGDGKRNAMTADEVQACFTRADGSYLFARWGRPIVPVVFGVDDATLAVVKGAIEAVVALAGHRMAETDAELGANLMLFFFRDWAELPEVPNLDRLVPDLGPLCARLAAGGANQYRLFRFDEGGAIKAAFVFLRMDVHLSALAAEDLALAQAAEVICLWGDRAFAETSPLARVGERVILRPDVAGLIRAGYAPAMPAVARDAAHALRLAARLG